MLSKIFTIIPVISAAILSAVPTSARIVGISTSSTSLTPGQTFPVTFHTSGYIQNNAQYYVVFGLAQSEYHSEGELLQLLGSGYDLVANGHSDSNTIGTFDVPVTIPADYYVANPGGDYVLTAAVMGTAGAQQTVSLKYWDANVTVA